MKYILISAVSKDGYIARYPGDLPNKWLWLGLFFIISSGIYISIRENKKIN